MPVTSSCGWTPKPLPSLWSSTTCGGTTATCWCKQSRRSRAGWVASPTIQRSTSASPSGSSVSSTVPNFCWPLSTSWLLLTVLKPSRSQPVMSRTAKSDSCYCARASIPMSTWTLGSGLRRLHFHQKRPSTPSSRTSTSATVTTPMRSMSGRPSSVAP